MPATYTNSDTGRAGRGAGAVVLPGPMTTQQSAPRLPFRRATVERCTLMPAESGVLGANFIPIERDVPGTGYIYSIRLQMIATAAGNAAAVAYTEDAPWNALNSIVLRDVNGEIINVPNGYYLYLANLAGKNYASRWLDQSSLASQVAGAGATGGSFTAWWDIPVGINRRDLLGILGNQDRAQKYSLRTDVATLAQIYTVAPTAAPAFVLNKLYENYSVPLPVGPNGIQQEVFPDGYGTVHFTTVTTSDSGPLGGSTVNHYLHRVGNTARFIILVFRSNGSRATADANPPTNIAFKVGDDTIFNETYAFRRSKMYERYGFDWPAGVLVYEAIHDFSNEAGTEIGDDYYHTQALVNAQFQIAYPSGFGSANNSLNIVTDDLVFTSPQG
jgi:hypothetical protein